MQFHRNKLAKPIIVFMAATCVYAPTYAQTVKTPMGELRIGMSEDQASSILHASIEDIGGVNMLRQRRISAKVGGQIFAAAVSSQHFVYLVSSQEFFPTAALGRQAAERMVQQYYKDFGASAAVSHYDRNGVEYQSWVVVDGLEVSVQLHCLDQAVVVEISDYSRKAADDGEDSLHYVTMDPVIDPFCF